jgi:hypothetical protein
MQRNLTGLLTLAAHFRALGGSRAGAGRLR